MVRCFTDIHAFGIFPEFLDIFFGNFLEGQTFLIRPADDLIVDISEILNKIDLVASVFQIAAKNVKNTKRSGVSDMDKVIDSRTAGVNFIFTRRYRYKFLLLSC